MFAIGSVYIKNSNLIEASQYELKEFAERYGRTVFITKRINDKIVYVYKYQPSNSKIVTPQEIGTVSRDFESGPIGKCYSVFDRAVLNKNVSDFDLIHKNKYALSSDNGNSHICTLAAPVWNFENRVVGVLVAADLAAEDQDREQIGIEFTKIAEHISTRLGYLGDANE
ncbi:MAG: hypothetical protein CVV63_04985 [Tenericutes bacterium HGW-Tenericutes-8]|nr:MAG: hypothetical protein CVV63_04985 [Tenericutes bacterium HGW-Tenericutes-8]